MYLLYILPYQIVLEGTLSHTELAIGLGGHSSRNDAGGLLTSCYLVLLLSYLSASDLTSPAYKSAYLLLALDHVTVAGVVIGSEYDVGG